MPIQIGGIVSGIDTDAIIQKLLEFDARTKQTLETKKTDVQSVKDLFATFDTQLSSFKTEADRLLLSSTFQKRGVTTSDSNVITATVADGAAPGVYSISVDNKATQSIRQSSAKISLSESLRSSSPVTAGTSPVDLNKAFASAGFDSSLVAASQIRIETSLGTYTSNAGGLSTYGTVQSFLDEINASAAGVRMWYDSSNDRFNLEIKNNTAATFQGVGLQELAGNFFTEINMSTGDPAMDIDESGLDVNATLVNLDTDTAITAGTGSFTINGTTISYDTSADTFQGLITRINNAQGSTGVTAFYDQTLDRLVLTRQTEGPQQIDIDTAADTRGVMTGGGLKISTAATSAGQQAKIFINEADGSTSVISSDSNTFTFNGITINIKGDGDNDSVQDVVATDQRAVVTVTTDTASVVTAVKSFVDAFNNISQFYKDNARYDAATKKAGKLFGDSLVNSVETHLKRMLFQPQTALVDTHELLAQLGIQLGKFNTPDANRLVVDETKLTAAIASNPVAVEQIFGRSTTGGSVKNAGVAYDISNYIKDVTKFQGLIDIKENFFTSQITDIDDRIFREDERIERIEATLRRQFNAMEIAVSKSNAVGASLTQQLNRL